MEEAREENETGENSEARDFELLDSLPEDRSLAEIGSQAVWSVTSAKAGNGVELLRDGKEDSFWQSDGPGPHHINVQFQKKVRRTCLDAFFP